jgi:hypothetical protein
MKYKEIPQKMFKEFKPINEIVEFDEFFEKYANGKKPDNGIISRHLGYANNVTIFWEEMEEYPFAYVYPKGLYEINGEFKTGYRFYLRKTI